MKYKTKTHLTQLKQDLPRANGHSYTVVGTRHRRVDAMQRLTGESQYTDDIVLPRMLHGKILRSPHAHANILAIDTTTTCPKMISFQKELFK